MLPITPGQPAANCSRTNEWKANLLYNAYKLLVTVAIIIISLQFVLAPLFLAGHLFLQRGNPLEEDGGYQFIVPQKWHWMCPERLFRVLFFSKDNATVIIELWWLWSDLVVHFLLAPTPSWSPRDACHIIISSWNCNGLFKFFFNVVVVHLLLFVLKVQLVNW